MIRTYIAKRYNTALEIGVVIWEYTHIPDAVSGLRKEKAMTTNRRSYLDMLLRQKPEWIRGSMAAPTQYMTRAHVLLHAVALRRMRAGFARSAA